MGVIVLVRCRSRLGHEEELVEHLRTRLGEQTHPTAARRRAEVLQGNEDPTELLYVASWDGRPAAQASLERFDEPRITALCEGDPVTYAYTELATFETVYRAPTVVASLLVEGRAVDAAVDEALRHLKRGQSPELPGLIQYDLGLDAQDPTRLVILHGWDAQASLDRFRATAGQEFYDWLRARQLHATRFQGCVRAQFTR